ncbi:hypothetical protein F3Y22_tig00111587pilonHSYRG00084 [Hibiscus syriacus]|uniref:Heparan-alpha-glucosaminide N-acetyltransferase catalytic domain-containing protein n=1 Tax=Hibiscus syriacus TaxID=106335 RepID=A0A6A2XL27_HIBSY|nr:hypothetical protein F3Y22_tig00111587pilonHSYRG00084 [Hibiscus syriacus]
MADPLKMEEGLARSNVDHVGEDRENMGKKEDKLVEEQQHLQQQQPLVKQKTKRVATLDAFRGLTIVLMILVDDAGGAYARIDHSPWNGCTLADFVMPFFLFIVGVAITLALKKIPKVKDAIRKICLRTLKLLFWGVLLQENSFGLLHCSFDRDSHHKAQTNSFETWIFIYFHCLQLAMVKCGMRGHLGPACNAVGYVDRQVWGINHLYAYPVWKRLKACTYSSPSEGPFREDAPSWCRAPFEPEGLLSSILAILSGTIGIHYGHVLIHFKGHSERLKQWVPMALGLLILAIILHFTDAIPINKQLYSFSCVFHCRCSRDRILSILHSGMNAMLIYVLGAQGILPAFLNGWYYESTNNTLVFWIQKHVFNNVWHSVRLGTLLYVIFAEIVFYGVLSGILHKLGIYWKL